MGVIFLIKSKHSRQQKQSMVVYIVPVVNEFFPKLIQKENKQSSKTAFPNGDAVYCFEIIILSG